MSDAYAGIWVSDLATAKKLRDERLMTSSLKFEPSFKHDPEFDDPDEELATMREKTPKKARKVEAFDFGRLLPLPLTREEAWLAEKVGVVRFERASAHLSSIRVAKLVEPADGAAPARSEREEHVDPTTASIRAVYEHMWRNGCTLVDGLKFGVHFLAYAGDPLRTHAEWMVLVSPAYEAAQLLSMMDFTALATVAAKTKKHALIASVEPASQRVVFVRMERQAVNLPRRGQRGPTREEAELDEVPASSSPPVQAGA